ncbi:hypothetical protein FPV16_15100 [Methylobacterium sp. W2]|uniref:hypothetical protein n=1 Tax=Methylobacterium sp. W2 TaxID=2598107 RepID=UPI001D0C3341|nr:hypothetical protein [Methylobacterium sp. W2]MCC0807540.1 hypothetical protein [Methylobacterium sp. W2]
MTAIDRFLLVASAYRQLSGLKTTALSWRLFGDSKKLGALESGADIQVTRYEKAMQWLSDHWPDPQGWPEGVDRPAKSEVATPEASAA